MAQPAASRTSKSQGLSAAMASRRIPPHLYFVVSAIFHYLGPSFAVLLFARVDVLGVAWLRIVSAALVFACWRQPWRKFIRLDRQGQLLIIGLGAVFALMNSCFYISISRLPLATVSAIEFLGPVALALVGVRTVRNLGAVIAASSGVYLLTHLRVLGEPVAIAFAFANAGLFTVYIALAHRLSRRTSMGGIDGLAAAMICALVFVSPIGLSGALQAFNQPSALAAGIGVGVSSSVIPYVFDQLAMARISRATYALFVALLPATAAIVGAIVLHQFPSLMDTAGIGLVMFAIAIHSQEPHAAGVPYPKEIVTQGMTPMLDLRTAADAAMDCLAVNASDDVLILCNAAERDVAQALAGAARQRSKRVQLVEFPALARDGQEPPQAAIQALPKATVVFAATASSISHTHARLSATRRGTRFASLPGITPEIFARAMPIDYTQLRHISDRVAAALTAASECHLLSEVGTDIVLTLKGRAGTSDNGNLQVSSAFGNLPAGEAYIAPIENSAEGTIVIDGAIGGLGLLREPLRLIIKEGRIITAAGYGAQWLLDNLDAGGSMGRVIAELGVGTNPKALLTGAVLEDEKVLGTAHIAFGTNEGFGGNNVAGVHIDCMLLKPLDREARLNTTATGLRAKWSALGCLTYRSIVQYIDQCVCYGY
jgi:inner membrane transporter RhtA